MALSKRIRKWNAQSSLSCVVVLLKIYFTLTSCTTYGPLYKWYIQWKPSDRLTIYCLYCPNCALHNLNKLFRICREHIICGVMLSKLSIFLSQCNFFEWLFLDQKYYFSNSFQIPGGVLEEADRFHEFEDSPLNDVGKSARLQGHHLFILILTEWLMEVIKLFSKFYID